MKETILNEIKEVCDLVLSIRDERLIDKIQKAAEFCIESLLRGGKIMFVGNGGSAADAQHLAAELVWRFHHDRPGIAAMALTTDTSVMTAISNDQGYHHVFARQVESLGQARDVLIAISTSGNSSSVLNAIYAAKIRGIKTIGFTGKHGGKMLPECDLLINVPSYRTPHIQEGHIIIGHILCGLIENGLFPR